MRQISWTTGLTGPRGKPGRSGIPGVPGIPGVNTWVVNATDPRRIVLVPPSIIGGEVTHQIHSKFAYICIIWHSNLNLILLRKQNVSRSVGIREGENLRLRCGTAGNPRPEVAWLKSDGTLIPLGSWKSNELEKFHFNFIPSILLKSWNESVSLCK